MTKFSGQAVNNNVVVKELQIENVTESGLDLTSKEDKDQKFKLGEIVSVGLQCPKRDDGTPSVVVGDKILFDSYKGTKLTMNAEVFTIIYFQDITIIL